MENHKYKQACKYGLKTRAIYIPEDDGGRGESVRPLAGLLDTALDIQKGQSCPEMLRYNGTACTQLQLLRGHDQLGKQSIR